MRNLKKFKEAAGESLRSKIIDRIDIKGIDDKKLHLHENYMISLLCSIFEAIQTQDISYCMSFINDIINKYISKSLPIEFYREFNSDSMYRVTMPNGLQYLFQTINDKDIQYLNIIHI